MKSKDSTMNFKLFCLLICVTASQLIIILESKEISHHSFLPAKVSHSNTNKNNLTNLQNHAQNLLHSAQHTTVLTQS